MHSSISQSINLYRAIVQRRVLHCGYAESERNVLRWILNVLMDAAVRQFSGREFQSLKKTEIRLEEQNRKIPYSGQKMDETVSATV